MLGWLHARLCHAFLVLDGDDIDSGETQGYRARQLYNNISMLFLFPVNDGKQCNIYGIMLRLVFNNLKLPYKTTAQIIPRELSPLCPFVCD